jgi:hypothetical protein
VASFDRTWISSSPSSLLMFALVSPAWMTALSSASRETD